MLQHSGLCKFGQLNAIISVYLDFGCIDLFSVGKSIAVCVYSISIDTLIIYVTNILNTLVFYIVICIICYA